MNENNGGLWRIRQRLLSGDSEIARNVNDPKKEEKEKRVGMGCFFPRDLYLGLI